MTNRFHQDLAGQPRETVEATYASTIAEVNRLDAERQQLYIDKKIRSEVIKFAVNKIQQPPVIEQPEAYANLIQAIAEKNEFDRLLSLRDELASRLAVPRHRLVQAMQSFHQRLTAPAQASESPHLAAEIEMFSRFFEMQAMVKVYDEHRGLHRELDEARKSLLETVKAINREDRKFSQRLTKNSEESHPLRREAGRLRAFLKGIPGANPQPVPEQVEEFTLRLAAGNSLSIEEFPPCAEPSRCVVGGDRTTSTNRRGQRVAMGERDNPS
jgi:hypothetical protein